MGRKRPAPPVPAADLAADDRWHHENLRARVRAMEAGDTTEGLRLRQEILRHDDEACPRTRRTPEVA